MAKHKILCIDDEQDIVDALFRLFRKDFDVLTATSGQDGLHLLKENKVSLIISDQKMPEMTGVETLKKSIEIDPDCIRILLTGYTDIESVIDSINSGEVYRYITKPWDPVDLENTVKKAIEKYEMRSELNAKNIELSKAYKELQSLDQSKTQFMYLINHELKTPLTVITSYTDLLKETKIDDEQSKFISRIQSSNVKLLTIVEDVLSLIKAETGILELKPSQTKTSDLTNGFASQFQAALNKKSLSLNINDENISFSTDADITKNIIERLLDNAIKFSHEKSKIHLDVKNINNKVEFSVINQGNEVKPEVIENIFKPFSLDENMMNHTTGIGLGLSLSQAYLKCLNSSLKIDCDNGEFKASFQI